MDIEINSVETKDDKMQALSLSGYELPRHLANSSPSDAFTRNHVCVLMGCPSWGYRNYLPEQDRDPSPVFGKDQHQLLQHKV